MSGSVPVSAPDVSIVIISHGHERYLPACLGSLAPALAGVAAEILLIDNLGTAAIGVSAHSPAPFRLHVNATPRGFAANCNLAAALTTGRYILLLNPDTEIASGTLAEAVAFLDATPDAGVLGCRLTDLRGTREENCRRFPTAPVFLLRLLGVERWPWRPRFYRASLMERESFDRTRVVDLVTGAFLLVRRTCWERTGGFDEQFFLYYEDADFCYRARQAGLRTYYFTGITVRHHHQRASRRLWAPPARRHLASALRFFRKHGLFPDPARSRP